MVAKAGMAGRHLAGQRGRAGPGGLGAALADEGRRHDDTVKPAVSRKKRGGAGPARLRREASKDPVRGTVLYRRTAAASVL